MFDDWIAMGLLSQAYNLNAIECIELAQRVPCKFGATSHNRAYDLKKIDHHAKEYARKLMGNSDQSATYSIYHLAMNQWRGDTHEQAKATWDAGYKFLWDRKAMKEAFGALWPVTRLFFITDLSVDKKQAVRLLAEAGYPLQNEVKGLTKTVVDGILASVESVSAQPPQRPSTTPEVTKETQPAPPELTLQDVGKGLALLAAGAQYVATEMAQGFQQAVKGASSLADDAASLQGKVSLSDTSVVSHADNEPRASTIEAAPMPQDGSGSDSVEQHVAAWTAVLPNLRGAELTAAKLAIEKWRGKSHPEAYRATIGGTAGNPKEYVSRKRATAEEVAKRYGLTMPDWKLGA